MSEPRWLDVKQVAAYLGLGRSTVYMMVASNQLVHYRLGPSGGLLRFKASDLDAYLEGARVGPKAKAAPAPAPAPAREPYVPKYDVSKPGSPLRESS